MFFYRSQISPLVGIKILENTKVNEKLEIFNANKDMMCSLVQTFYQRVTILYERNNSLLYKYLILIILEKIIIFSAPNDLIQYSNFSTLSQFLYRLLQSLDLMIVVLCLLIVDAFLNRTPNIINEFWREGVIEQLKNLKKEKEINRLTLVSLTRNQKNDQKLQGFANNGNASNVKYESVAEKMKNLNNLINKIDKNINDIYQPKLISNIKNSNEKKPEPAGNSGSGKKNMSVINSVVLGKKGEVPQEKINDPANKIGSFEGDKGNFVNEYNATKMTFIRKDTMALISDLHEKVKSLSVLKNYSESSEKINLLLTELINLLNILQEKHHDSDAIVFEKMQSFLTKYKRFTNYEIKTHKLIANLNEYMFEGLLSHKLMEICDEKQEISFSNRDSYEFSRGTESEPFPEIDITDEQVNRISRKLFLFSNFLLAKNPNNPQSQLFLFLGIF